MRDGAGTPHTAYTDDAWTILVRRWRMHPEETASSVRAARPGPLHVSPYERVIIWTVP